jgi:hypothetical protein
MATIPGYGGQQVGLAVQNPTGFQSPQGYDSGTQARATGEAIGAAGSSAMRIATDMQEQANALVVDDAYVKALRMKNVLKTDKDTGWMNAKGFDAITAKDGKSLSQRYSEQYDSALEEIQSGLNNDAQRQAFTQKSLRVKADMLNDIDGHMLQQYNEAQSQTHDSKIKLSNESLVDNPYNPEVAKQAAQDIRDSVIALNPGASPEVLKVKMQEARTPGHAAVISKAIEDGNIEFAKDYIKKNGDELTIRAKEELGAAVMVGDERVKTQTAVDGYLSRGLSYADALVEAKKKTGLERDQLVKEVHAQYSEIDSAKAKSVTDLKNSGWSQVFQTSRMPTALTMARLVNEAPEEARQMRDYLDSRNKRLKDEAENNVKTDYDKWYGLMRMAMQDPQTFAGLELRKSKYFLSNSDFENLARMQLAIERKDPKIAEVQDLISHAVKAPIVVNAINKAGINLNAKADKPDDLAKTEMFLGVMTSELQKEIETAQANNKKYTKDDVEKKAMSLLQEYVQQGTGIGGWFQTKMRGYEIKGNPDVKGGNFVATTYDKIPVDVRDELLKDYVNINKTEFPNGMDSIPRSIYGRREHIVDSKLQAAIEQAYQRGKDRGRF